MSGAHACLCLRGACRFRFSFPLAGGESVSALGLISHEMIRVPRGSTSIDDDDMTQWMTIERPQVSYHHGQARLSCWFTSSGARRELWYNFDAALAPYLCFERCDGFLIALLTLAMSRKENIRLLGPVSEQLFYNTTRSLIPILCILLPELTPIQVTPQDLVIAPLGGNEGVGTGFSGGIDSFCTVAEHLDSDVPSGFRVTHLVHANVGAYGPGGRAVFTARQHHLQACATQLGLPLITIDSNLDDHLVTDFSSTHSLRNLSCVLLLQGLFRRFLYSSAYSFGDCNIVSLTDGAAMDPMAIHLLSTESTQSQVVGCQYSRIAKTQIVSAYPLSYDFLTVCVQPEEERPNCSVCWKCARTQLTLEMLGALKNYQKVFDLARYHSIRSGYIADLRDSPRLLCREVLSHASAIDYPLARAIGHE